MNPNDKTRSDILKWFYDRNAQATSQYGKKGSASKISDVKKGMKDAYGLKQQEVMSNMTYLIDKGWVNKTEEEKTFITKAGSVPSKTTWYEVSSSGIDKIEGESEFQDGGKFSGININATGSNVITLGDGNVVNVKFKDLHTELSKIKEAASLSTLDEVQKLDVVVDIESIKEQLIKSEPDKTIVGHLWNRIENIATIGGFATAVTQAAPYISSLLP
jgi:hypothetical protein